MQFCFPPPLPRKIKTQTRRKRKIQARNEWAVLCDPSVKHSRHCFIVNRHQPFRYLCIEWCSSLPMPLSPVFLPDHIWGTLFLLVFTDLYLLSTPYPVESWHNIAHIRSTLPWKHTRSLLGLSILPNTVPPVFLLAIYEVRSYYWYLRTCVFEYAISSNIQHM